MLKYRRDIDKKTENNNNNKMLINLINHKRRFLGHPVVESQNKKNITT